MQRAIPTEEHPVADAVSIEARGTGCPNRTKVGAFAREAIAEPGVEAAGRVPSKAEVTSWLTTAVVDKQG